MTGSRSTRGTLALALSALAVVLAATGTAVAVTATTVNIADPTAPTHIAHVDSSGRLTTTGVTSTISSWGGLYASHAGADKFATSPTTASLAITGFRLSNPQSNDAYANTEFSVYIDRVDSSSSTSCVITPGTDHLLRVYIVAPGQQVEDVLPSPLVVRPTNSTTPYCLDLYTMSDTGEPTPGYSPAAFDLTAYVYGGTYTGTGTGAATGRPARLR